MSDKFKKIDREFLLSDSTTNVYSYRLLTSGYQIEEFKKNPIGYYLHGNAPEYPREAGVLVKWEDLRIDGDSIYGKPVINLSHARGEKTVQEIEDGFLNAASLGKIVALEISNDPALKLPGQTGPTVTKWFNRECSLVDIPGNMNAVAAELYDQDDKLINLADFTITKIENMNQIFLTPEQLTLLNLSDNTDTAAVGQALKDLWEKANKADVLQKQLDDLNEKNTLDKVDGILQKALGEKKITVELSNKLKTDYAKNAEGLQNLVDSFPSYTPITQNLGAVSGSNEKELSDLCAMSGRDLYMTGKLERLKDLSLEHFKPKYKEYYGQEYQA